MLKKTTIFLLASLLLLACQKDETTQPGSLDSQLESALRTVSPSGDMAFFAMPPSNALERIPQDPKNKLTPEKISLGKFLYHETKLAIHPKYQEGKFCYSCASCHHVAAGFQAGVRQGIGDGGFGFGDAGETRIPDLIYDLDSIDVQPIRTPTAMNGAYQEVMLWNGQFGATGPNVGTESQWTPGTPKETNLLGFQGLETQAIAGLKVHRMGISEAIADNEVYLAMFEKAFPSESEEERLTREKAGLAIAAYERTLLASEAPFQRWLQGDKGALSDGAKQGAILFFGSAGCVSCHTGPALNSMEFYALGMGDLLGPGIYGSQPETSAHRGRADFTGAARDEFKFKVPQLYNLTDSKFFGHGGTFRSVREVVEYKNEAIPAKIAVPHYQLAEQFRPLNLTDQEIDFLVTFIEEGLYDPELIRYVPESLPSGACFPNGDVQSKLDLGCD